MNVWGIAAALDKPYLWVRDRLRRLRDRIDKALFTDDPSHDGPGFLDSQYRDPDEDRVISWLEVMERQRRNENPPSLLGRGNPQSHPGQGTPSPATPTEDEATLRLVDELARRAQARREQLHDGAS